MDPKQYVTSSRGSFRIGAMLGMALLWLVNAVGSLPSLVTNILFPSPLINVTMGWLVRLTDMFCADMGAGSDAVFVEFCARSAASGPYHSVATVWIYLTVGFYYGILGVFLARLYILAKKRTDW